MTNLTAAMARNWKTSWLLGLLLLGLILAACDEQKTATSGATTQPPVTVTTTGASATTAAAPGVPTATSLPASAYPPILFVHGNGDSSALWITTLWRFESNGYPRERLFTIDFPSPTARDDDTKDEINRSSTQQQREQLAARVDEVLAKTGASKLVLIGNSRGGNSIRNYIKNGGGASKVSHAILGGTPNHGVVSVPIAQSNNEFNGAGKFLKDLNSSPDEVVAGVAFMTIRSDRNDKFAQPKSLSNPVAVGYAGPELKGATNVVLDGVDHRETAYSSKAFAEMYKFIMGHAPTTTDIIPETNPQITGLITGWENGAATNKPVAGVTVSVFEVDPKTGARLGPAVSHVTTGADGKWGNFTAKPTAYYEFMVEAPDDPVRHWFRSPFPRSSSVVSMRLADAEAEQGKAVVFFTRPRGYVADGRDQYSLDGKPVPGVKGGVPTDASFQVVLDGPERAVPVSLNGENMTVRAIPNEIVYAEFHY